MTFLKAVYRTTNVNTKTNVAVKLKTLERTNVMTNGRTDGQTTGNGRTQLLRQLTTNRGLIVGRGLDTMNLFLTCVSVLNQGLFLINFFG